MWKEAVVDYLKVISRQFLSWTEENHEKASDIIVYIPDDIRIKHLPNTNENRYRY
jgi:uncharacterized protein YfdQ (DUF2303 family)